MYLGCLIWFTALSKGYTQWPKALILTPDLIRTELKSPAGNHTLIEPNGQYITASCFSKLT